MVLLLLVAGFSLTFGTHFKNQNHYETKRRKDQSKTAKEDGYTEDSESDNATAKTQKVSVMRNIVIIIIIAVGFCVNEATWTFFYPLAHSDWDAWTKYFALKDAGYDTMFLLFSLLLFWNFKEPLPKALTVFLITVTSGSFIDKVIFDLNQYLLSDVVLILMGILLSIINYRKWKTLTSKPGV